LKDFYLTGSGLNTYGNLMLMYPETDRTLHAQQAHSDYVQLAVEGGLLVGIPVLVAIGLFGRAVARRLGQPQDEMTWWIRLGAVAGICGMALQEITEFSLQIPGVAVLFTVLVAIAVHEPAPVQERRRAHSRRELSLAV
jgi:O-antigen ligase